MTDTPNKILFKRSSESGKKPTAADIAPGELAINTADGVLYTTKEYVVDNQTIQEVVSVVGVNTSLSYTWTNVHSFNSDVNFNGGILVNNSRGSDGQVLTSNGTTVSWQNSKGSTGGVLTTFTYTVTADTSVITGADDTAKILYYTLGLESIYVNGSKQAVGIDYNTTDPYTITFTSNLLAGDLVQVVAINSGSSVSGGSGSSSISNKNFIIDYTDTTIPQTPVYYSDKGRFYRDISGNWVRTTVANQELIYYDTNGNVLGLDMSPADTYLSAPFDYATNPANTDPVYLTKKIPSTNANVVYASAHTQPSIFDTSGKGVLVNLGGYTSYQEIVANNIVCTAANTDLVRVEMIFAVRDFDTPTDKTDHIYLTKNIISGGTNIAAYPLDMYFDSTETLVSSTSRARRASCSLMQIKDGVSYYFAWFEDKVTGDVVITPKVGWYAPSSNSSISTRKLLIQDLRIVKNGSTIPNAAPVCAVNKTFNDSYLKIGTTNAIDIKFDRLRKGRTKVTDGSIKPIRKYRSRPNDADMYLHYERKIELSKSIEDTSVEFIMPNYYQYYDFVPVTPGTSLNGVITLADPVEVYLSDAYFNQIVTNPSPLPTEAGNQLFNNYGYNITIKGAFKSPKRWAQIFSFYTNGYSTGDVIIQNVNIFMRSSTFGEQIGQTIPRATNISGNNISISYSAFSGHTQHHTRGNKRVHYGEYANSINCRWIGEFNLSSTGNLSLNEVLFSRIGRTLLDNGLQSKRVNLNYNGVRGDKIWSDFVYVGRGTYSGIIQNIASLNQSFENWWQYHSRDEIMIDRGNGLEYLSAAGLYATDLPSNRKLHLYSYRSKAGDPIDQSNNALFLYGCRDRTLLLYPYDTYWGDDHQGYQAALSKATVPFTDRRIAPGLPGPKYLSYSDALTATSTLPTDTFLYVFATDANTHVDPFSNTSVLNRGVYRKMDNLGLVRIANSWPSSSGTRYSSLASLIAGGGFTQGFAGIIDSGADAGVYEYTGTVWAKIDSNIQLPVYASTPGIASANNLHVYLTIDHIAWPTGRTQASYTYTNRGQPIGTGASTHADFFQFNTGSQMIIDGLTIKNAITYGETQFIYPSPATASTDPIYNFTLQDSIAIMKGSYTASLVQSSFVPGYQQIYKNICVLPSYDDEFFHASNYRASVPAPSFLIYGAGVMVPNQITVNNFWIGTYGTTASVLGSTINTTNILSALPNKIEIPSYYDIANTTYPTPTANGVSMRYAYNSNVPTKDWFIKDDVPLKNISFDESFEKRINIPLNSILQNVMSHYIFSSDVDEMIDWQESTFQREPDLTLYVDSTANVGTVIATGVDGSEWHKQWSGAEDGYFDLTAGTITIKRRLTDPNPATGNTTAGLNLGYTKSPSARGFSNDDIITIVSPTPGYSNAIISMTTDANGFIIDRNRLLIKNPGSGFTNKLYDMIGLAAYTNKAQAYITANDGISAASGKTNLLVDGLASLSLTVSSGSFNNNDIITIVAPPGGVNAVAYAPNTGITSISSWRTRGDGWPVYTQLGTGTIIITSNTGSLNSGILYPLGTNGYNNSDIVIVNPGPSGVNAVATISTNSNGVIKAIFRTNYGSGFPAYSTLDSSYFTIVGNTGGPAVGNTMVTGMSSTTDGSAPRGLSSTLGITINTTGIYKILATSGGTGYNNNDIITVISDSGYVNAIATISTDSTGSILSTNIVNAGSGFTILNPILKSNILISNTTGGTAAGSSDVGLFTVSAGGISSISVPSTPGYNNSDLIVVTSGYTKGIASISTNSNGVIQSTSIYKQNFGSGLNTRGTTPTIGSLSVLYTSNTGGPPNGTAIIASASAVVGGIVFSSSGGFKNMYVTDNLSIIDIDVS